MTALAPIVVFGYNRPDHLRRTLTQLSQAEGAKQSPLWIFCDGPKPGADHAKTTAVRGLANDPVWITLFQSVRVIAAESNKGLARSIIDGVTRVIEEAGYVIVIEDDLLVAPDFLRFMNDALHYYRDDSNVGSVTAFSPLTAPPPGYQHDVIAVPRNCSHGWGTWADRWSKVDWDACGAEDLWRNRELRHRFNVAGNDRLDRLRRQLEGKIDSWSIRFGLWQTLSGRHTIYPVQNRVQNIGFDGTGVHTRHGQEINEVISMSPTPYKLSHVVEDPDILRAFRQTYSGPWHKRVYRGIRAQIMGPKKRN